MSTVVENRANELRHNLNNMLNDYTTKLNNALTELQKAKNILLNTPKEDRSENSEYQDAIENYKACETDVARYTRRRDAFMSYEGDNYLATGIIKEGTTVELTNLSDNKHFIMLLVPHDLGDAANNYLAVTSAVGSAILGHKSNETVTIKTIHGIQQYKIGDIY